nr:MAG TPA: hypothetical protein [Caudoviricetes sp.]
MKKSIKKSRTAAANNHAGDVTKDIMKAFSVYHGLLPNASVGEVKFWRIHKNSGLSGLSSPQPS